MGDLDGIKRVAEPESATNDRDRGIAERLGRLLAVLVASVTEAINGVHGNLDRLARSLDGVEGTIADITSTSERSRPANLHIEGGHLGSDRERWQSSGWSMQDDRTINATVYDPDDY